ncbi:hypothetical protein SAMN05443287_11377 [Micromonospora phaseoli]|uniref:Uncharacterized protein n=1 Tax=Micromonospora phaseoli TaxID=1144548 RepID=A0A1H7DNT9_9ACTN|nr:hypothetical protein CLV64_11360 [Micromonospora phaseoli]SEJ99915.1 hypothetical protein SAMN05443287_11377 [Micromonospora phaseoli]
MSGDEQTGWVSEPGALLLHRITESGWGSFRREGPTPTITAGRRPG